MNTEKIRQLNDILRKTFIGGRVMLTTGIRAKSAEEQAEILQTVRLFNEFTKANDPYGEHDFGSFDYKGQKIFWKIDYYDNNLQYLSEDPTDVSKTIRVITILLAEEY